MKRNEKEKDWMSEGKENGEKKSMSHKRPAKRNERIKQKRSDSKGGVDILRLEWLDASGDRSGQVIDHMASQP